MDGKYDKKKESIDEILSDLNGLLNKMPSILDGIKMPEMQPLDLSKPSQEPAPLKPAEIPAAPAVIEPVPAEPAVVPAVPFDADKTVVLESFSGLPEGSPAPEEIPAAPAVIEPVPAEPAAVPVVPFDGDKTVVLESFSGLPEGAQAPGEIPAFQTIEPASPRPEPASPDEADKTIVLESFSRLPEGADAPVQATLPVQTLGDFMFGADSEPEPENPAAAAPVKLSGSPLEPPADKPAIVAASGPSLSVSEFTPPAQNEKAPAAEPLSDYAGNQPAGAPEADLPGVPAAAPDEMVFNQGWNVEEQASGVVPDVSGPQGGQLSEQLSGLFNADEAAAEQQPDATAYGNTRDFGVPDIDALMQMSEEGATGNERPPQSLPEAGMIPESVQAIEAQKDEPSFPALADSLTESGEEPAMAEQDPEKSAEAVTAADLQDAQSIGQPGDKGQDQSLAEFESQFLAAAPQGEIVEVSEPEKNENEVPQPEAPLPATEPERLIIEPEVKPETSFEAFTIEPSSSGPMSAQDGGETLSIEPASELQPVQDGGETLSVEPAPELQPAQDAGETLRIDPAPESLPAAAGEEALSPEPFSGAASGAAPELQAPELPDIQFGAFLDPADAPKIESGQGIQFGSGEEQPAASGIELSPGIELGAGSPVQSGNPDETLPGGPGLELGGPASPSLSGDETMVVSPPAGSSGEEEKTVIFQASPATTSRAQASDLSSLAARQVPEGIPAERVRSVAFVYSPGDEALCATVLAELDAICLKSAAKPMFIKRAYVKDCDIDSNANFVHQSVTDSGAAGLVCLGGVPQEKVYEIENVFASSGGFFRYYDSSTFTHSSALDLISDLIVR